MENPQIISLFTSTVNPQQIIIYLRSQKMENEKLQITMAWIDSWPMHSVHMHMHSISPCGISSILSLLYCCCHPIVFVVVYGTNELASFEYFRLACPAEDFHAVPLQPVHFRLFPVPLFFTA